MNRELYHCKHCGEIIRQIVDPWGGTHGWVHNPDDGPDAYVYCRMEDGSMPEAEPGEIVRKAQMHEAECTF